MSEQADEYLLGTTARELDRLGFQHGVWIDFAQHLWRTAGFSAGQSLLDMGCGPGFATLDLAKITGPEGHVHAMDAAGNYLEHLRGELDRQGIGHVSLQQGDVGQVALDDASTDGVFARWLFCFLADTRPAIREALRVLRPGGRLVIWDYFNYLAAGFYPPRKSFEPLFTAFEESNNRRGGSYQVGGQLPGQLLAEGFEIVAIEPLCRAIRPGTPHWRWFEMFRHGFAPGLVTEGLLSAAEYDAMERDMAAFASDPASFFFPPPQLGIVAQKPR